MMDIFKQPHILAEITLNEYEYIKEWMIYLQDSGGWMN